MALDLTKPATNSAALTADVRGNFTALDTAMRGSAVTATVGNVGTGEDQLASITVPAGTLLATGDWIEGVFWGKSANNANAKAVRVRVIEGGNNTEILGTLLLASILGHWVVSFTILRTGATTFRSGAQLIVGPTNETPSRSVANVSSATATWANAVEVRITGEATANDDITIEGGSLRRVAA